VGAEHSAKAQCKAVGKWFAPGCGGCLPSASCAFIDGGGAFQAPSYQPGEPGRGAVPSMVTPAGLTPSAVVLAAARTGIRKGAPCQTCVKP
jgi:hypothetical protein